MTESERSTLENLGWSEHKSSGLFNKKSCRFTIDTNGFNCVLVWDDKTTDWVYPDYEAESLEDALAFIERESKDSEG